MAADTALKDARESVWDAILNWAELDGVWKRKYRHDESGGDDSPEIDPKPAQLPAIRIVPDASPVDAVLNRESEIQYSINIWIYGEKWYLPTLEGYVLEIIKSVFRPSTGTPATDYVKAATGYHPLNKFSIFPPAFIKRKDAKITRAGLRITLRVRFDPFSD